MKKTILSEVGERFLSFRKESVREGKGVRPERDLTEETGRRGGGKGNM